MGDGGGKRLTALRPTFAEAGLYDVHGFHEPTSVCPSATATRTTYVGEALSDAVILKKKLKQAISKHKYDVTEFYAETGWAQAVARSQLMEYTTLFVILLNSFWIAYDTDANNEDDLLKADLQFILAEFFFASFFTVELSIRLAAFVNKRDALRDGWFALDAFMVALMLFETYIYAAICPFVGMSSQKDSSEATGLLKILKMLRLLRVARIAKLMRVVPELIILVKGMMVAGKSVIVTLTMLSIVLYVFALIFTQMSATYAPLSHKAFFATFMNSANTLWLAGILCDDTADLAAAIRQESRILLLVFYMFILLSSFMVMNLLIGILCEVIIEVSRGESEQVTIEETDEKLRTILRMHEELFTPQRVDYNNTITSDGDMAGFRITKEVFLHMLEDPRVANLLHDIYVDVFGLVDLVDALFSGDSGEARTLSFAELLAMLLELRGTNTAKVKDITDVRRLIHVKVDSVNRNIQVLSDRLESLGAMFESAVGQPGGQFAKFVAEAKGISTSLAASAVPRNTVAPDEPVNGRASRFVLVNGAPEEWCCKDITEDNGGNMRKSAEVPGLGTDPVMAATVGKGNSLDGEDNGGTAKIKKKNVRVKVRHRTKSADTADGCTVSDTLDGIKLFGACTKESSDDLDESLKSASVQLAEIKVARGTHKDRSFPHEATTREPVGQPPEGRPSVPRCDAESSWQLRPLRFSVSSNRSPSPRRPTPPKPSARE